MNPDVPAWARAVLRRELLDVDLDGFQVLKDSPLRKVGIGYTSRGAFLVMKSVAGEELHRVDHTPRLGIGPRTATCTACHTTFQFERLVDGRPLHCMACGERVQGEVASASASASATTASLHGPAAPGPR